MRWLMVGRSRNIEVGGFVALTCSSVTNASSNPLNGSIERKRRWCSIKLKHDTMPAANALFSPGFLNIYTVMGEWENEWGLLS